jgi:hypothetical protein
MEEPIAQPISEGREIKDVAVLDLTGVNSADSLKDVTKISDVALIVVPESLSDALMRIPMEDVATIVPVPEGANVRTQTGQLTVSGESLAFEGDAGDNVLALIGQIFITPPIDRVNCKLVMAGQIFAPKGSEAAIGAATVRLTGQIAYYTGTPRFFNGDQTFERGFFEFLGEPISMILNGSFRIEPDVTLDLLKEKVSGITLNGQLKAPKAIVPALKALADSINGQIIALEDEASEPA